MKTKLLSISIVAALFASSAMAADYEVDAAHSHVGFSIRHIVSKVPGFFKDYNGTFNFDEKNPEKSKAKFEIKTASINTGNVKRDDHLRNEDFFDAKKYPSIQFESKKVTSLGGNKYKLEGDMTMRGVTKPVSFDVEYTGAAKDPWGNMKAGFSATAQIKRKDWGLSWNKALDNGGLVLGEDVTITVEVEANQKK